MSGILSLFGVGMKSKNTDRKNQLAGWGDLTKLATGEAASGTAATGLAQGYDSKLLSGNRDAVTSAVAPATNAAADQAASIGRERSALGTSRGGGTNDKDQQTSDLVNSTTQTAINAAVPNAAANLGTLGQSQTGQAGSFASSLASDAGYTRQFDVTNSQKNLHDSIDEVAALLKKFPGKTGAVGGDASSIEDSGGGSDVAAAAG